MKWRDQYRSANEGSPGPSAGLHRWVLGLPWVRERPLASKMPGVRMFAVDCPPLALRQLWLVTGLTRGLGIVVVVPADLAEELETVGVGRVLVPMPAGNVIVRVSEDADRTDIEMVLLRAYSSAMAAGIGTNL